MTDFEYYGAAFTVLGCLIYGYVIYSIAAYVGVS